MKRILFLICFFIICIALFISCGEINSKTLPAYYKTENAYENEQLAELFAILNDEESIKTNGEIESFFALRSIANIYLKQKEYQKLINFFSAWGAKYPDSEYKAYYLLAIANAYIKLDAYPAAALYFDMIVKNEDDLIVGGKSIHLECLKQLIDLVKDNVQKAWYYEKLISRFITELDVSEYDAAAAYFLLGRTYEELGEWNKAINCYSQFLPYYIESIQGYPDAYTYAKQLADFNNSSKNWGFDSLEAVIAVIKSALDEGNIRRLWQYRARVNFFARSWVRNEIYDEGMTEFNLSTFAASGRIRYADNLETSSNSNEAYLRTSGWSSLLTPVWYFYFRKIYFPPDPEIHGKWEWAGIYYGEKF